MSTEAPHRITTEEELEDALSQEAFLLVKHSPTCPISARAFAEYRAFVRAHGDLPSAWIHVVDERPLSQGIAARTGVRHESPQAILFERGEVQWHASHGEITSGALERARKRPV